MGNNVTAKVTTKVRKPQPTLYDVCRLSGVSTATVSRVFSGTARVSEEVRARVMNAANDLSYAPSHSARSLAARRTNTIGTIFPEIANGFYADILAGIDEVAAENQFDVLAAFVGTRRSRSQLIDRFSKEGRVDALLLMNLDNASDLAPETMQQIPIVLIDRGINGTELPAVGIDNVSGAEAMVEHFFEQGHRRIAVLTGPVENYDSSQRLLGCEQAMSRLGLSQDPKLVWRGDFTMDSGTRAAREHLRSGDALPDAIFCFNDAMAIGMLNEFDRAGIHAPDNVAVGGFDDVEAAEHLSLTSVSCPMRLMGQMAAQWAIELVTTNVKPVSHRLQVRLTVRRSSGPRNSGLRR